MPNNFDPTTQNLLAAAPFFDDWDEAKNYYRVLFRPAVAVQARELNQQQTILQNQVAELASTIYDNGSVVEGCSVEYIPDLEWVAIADYFSTSSSLAQNDPSLTNAVAIGNTSGVQAYIVATQAGFASQEPGKFFVRYTAPGPSGNTTFLPGEYLNVFSSNSSYVEDIVLTCNSSVSSFASAIGQTVQCVQTGNSANVLATAVITSVDNSSNTITVNNINDFFVNGQTLILINSPTTNTGINNFSYNTGSLIGSINVLCSGSNPYILAPANGIMTTNTSFTNAYSTGYAYGAYISNGVIYQGGFFVDVDSQTIIVNSSNASPANYSLGFTTKANIVTQDIDSSLNDNALGYPNLNAPGAYRLQLTAQLVAVSNNQASSNANFFPIVQFSNSGVVFENIDPSYSTLGDALAQRTYDEAGHFVINPFTITSNTDPQNTDGVIVNVGPGLAYVEGERIQLLNNLSVSERRGVDTTSSVDRVITTSYGNYVVVDQLRGFFDPSSDVEVLLYDTAQLAITNGLNSSNSLTGNQIGTATLRALSAVDVIQGQPNSSYRMYLFNISMANNSLSFTSVKSICRSSGGIQAFSDVIGTSASLVDAAFTSMIFPLGSVATKTLSAAGIQNSNYYYTATAAGSSTYLDTTGTLTFSVPSAGGELGFGVGAATTPELPLVSVVMLANTASANLTSTANVYSNGVVICGQANFGTSIFYPGCFIGTPGGVFNVTGTINTTAVVTTAIASQSNVKVWRVEKAGSVVPLDGITRTLTFSNSTSGYASFGLGYTASVNAAVTFYAYGTNLSAAQKKINRNTTVLIQPNNSGNDVGPWCIGVPDVVTVSAIYPVANNNGVLSVDFSNNVINNFTLDDGQRDGFYDLGSINLQSYVNPANYANSLLLVMVDHFTANTKGGYFSIDSYPVDDDITANTLATIATAEIPQYVSSQQTYNLRDCVDFRPYVSSTANIGNNLGSASLNPATSTAFDANTTGFTPYPSGNFICNLTQYLGRKDVLLLSSSGSFNIAEGVAATAPQYPVYDANTNLAIANIVVPPYPSLPSNEITSYPDAPSSYNIQIIAQSHRRYTMNDIGSLDTRITQLEYYTTLNTLESAAASTSVINGNGQQQFQNGIFVDPLNDFSFSNSGTTQFTMAIDTQNGYGRPQFIPEFFDVSFANSLSQNIQQTGRHLSLAYTSEPFIQQKFASAQQILSGLPPSYIGTLTVYPNYWLAIETNGPVVSSASTSAAKLAQAPFTMDYGWWRDSVSSSLNDSVDSSNELRNATNISGSSSSSTSYSLNDITSVRTSVVAYSTDIEMSFWASGLKPYTAFDLYIDLGNVNAAAAPGTLNPNVNHVTGDPSARVIRSGSVGSLLVSDSQGNLQGMVSTGPYITHSGVHTVTLIEHGKSAAQTSGAAAAFIIGVTYQSATAHPKPQRVINHLSGNTLTSYFTMTSPTSALTTNAPNFPTLSFVDESVSATGAAIASWSWSFGDGTSQTVNSPYTTVYHTYNNMTTSTQSVSVVLTVTDVNSNVAKSVQTFNISQNIPAIPASSAIPKASIIVTTPMNFDSVSNTMNTASGSLVTRTVSGPSASIAATALISNTVIGAYWNWSLSSASGTAANTFIASPSTGNSQFGATLNSNNTFTSGESSFTLTASYQTNSTNIISTASMPIDLIISPPVPVGSPATLSSYPISNL